MLVSLKPCFCSSLAEPCPRCAAPYGFQNVMTLSSDTGRFSVSVQQIVSPSQLRNLFSSVVFFFYVFVVLFSLFKHQQVFEVIQTNLDMSKFFILTMILFKTSLIKYIFFSTKIKSTPCFYILVLNYTVCKHYCI